MKIYINILLLYKIYNNMPKYINNNDTEVLEDDDIYGESIKARDIYGKGVIKLPSNKKIRKQLTRAFAKPVSTIDASFRTADKQAQLGINKIESGLIKTSDTIKDTAENVANKISNYAETIIEGRNDYPPSVRELIKQFGEKHITNITADRTPVPSVLTSALNAVSFGAFKKRFKQLPYDKLFHLRLDLTFNDNTRLAVEKNEVINMYKNPKRLKGSEQKDINNIPFNLTLNSLLEGGQKIQGNKFFNYSAYNNNCQDFIIALLKGSGIGSPEDYNFIKQNTESLFKGDAFLRKFANTVTDIGAKANEITQGTGIENKSENIPLLKYKNKINNNNYNNKMPKYYSDSDSSDSEADSDDERDIIKHIHIIKDKIKRHNEMKGGKIKIAKAFKKLGSTIKKGLGDIEEYATAKKGGLASDVIKYGIPATSSAVLGGLATAVTGGNPVAGVAASALGSKLGAMGAKELQEKTGTGIHIDIASHNAKGSKAKTGEGLRKRKALNLTRAKNTSLEQLLEAMEEKDTKAHNKLLKQVAEKQLSKLKAHGYGLPFSLPTMNMDLEPEIGYREMKKEIKPKPRPLTNQQHVLIENKMKKASKKVITGGRVTKGSEEAKERMAKLRAMRGKK